MKNEIRILTDCSLIKGEFEKQAVSVNLLFPNAGAPKKITLPLAKFIVLLE